MPAGPNLVTPLPSTSLALDYIIGTIMRTPTRKVQLCVRFANKELEVLTS